eukprot:scaffold109592_cov14-Tisochrysis_lutea.AAC.2
MEVKDGMNGMGASVESNLLSSNNEPQRPSPKRERLFRGSDSLRGRMTDPLYPCQLIFHLRHLTPCCLQASATG